MAARGAQLQIRLAAHGAHRLAELSPSADALITCTVKPSATPSMTAATAAALRQGGGAARARRSR